MSKARKIVTYLMVGMMVLSNFQNRLYADDEEPSAPAEPVVADTPSAPEPEPAPAPEPEPVVVPDPEPETPEVPSESAGQTQTDNTTTEGDQPTSDSDETHKTGENEENKDQTNVQTDGQAQGQGEKQEGDQPASDSDETQKTGENEENKDQTNVQTDGQPQKQGEQQGGELPQPTDQEGEKKDENPEGTGAISGQSEIPSSGQGNTTSSTTNSGGNTTTNALSGNEAEGSGNLTDPSLSLNSTEIAQTGENTNADSDTPSDPDTSLDQGLKMNPLNAPMLKSPLRANNFTFDTITISKPAGYTGEGPESFVILDRNLGATSNDIDSPDSYGYQYQWGNNYGFPIDEEITISETLVEDVSGYGPSNPYSGDVFIGGDWVWSENQNDNLRGGTGDSAENNRGLNTIETTAIDRKGPCPDGYHVPSAGEWSKVVEYRAIKNGVYLDESDLKGFSNSDNGKKFSKSLKLPLAGVRVNWRSSLAGQQEYAYYWSSSSSDGSAASEPDGAYVLSVSELHAGADGNLYRSSGAPVRCFQNSSSNSSSQNPSGFTLSFDSDGGSSVTAITGLEAGDDISGYRPKKDPQKAGQMFLGWFDANGERFMFEGKTISEDMTLTAHWAPFNDLVYTGEIDGVLKTIVLMDRNLGATSLDLSSQTSDGYFYQWGNNFGFESDMSKNQTSTTKVDVSAYGPENPYYGEKFIKQTDWNTSSNFNLRGGNGDNFSNNFDNENERIQRQGPCPEGYYIPSLEEGNELVTLYLSNQGIPTTSIGGYDYPATVGKQDDARYMLDEEHEADFRQTFNLPQAGMIRNSGKKERHRTDTTNNRHQAFLSTSTPHGTGKYMLMETNVGGNNKGNYINVGGWINSIGDATPIRCFKSITETPIDPEVNSGAIVITTEAGKTVAHIYDNGEPIELTGDIAVDEVILHRTFTPNVPSTIVVPFDIDAGKYEGGTFYLFDGIEWNNADDSEDGETWEVKRLQADTIEAHTPYLFIPSSSTLTITGPVTLKEGASQEITKGDWTFKGVYEKKNWNADSSTEFGLSSTGDFVKIGAESSLNPMRAYLSYEGENEEDICEDLIVVVDPTVTITTDGKGSVSKSYVTVASGTAISFSNNTVTIGDTTITATPKAATTQSIYTFSSWENTCGDTVTNSCTIKAKFAETPRKYSVMFKNWDQNGNLYDFISLENLEYGTIPSYGETDPVREADAQYSYTFTGWTDGENEYGKDEQLPQVTKNVTYTALYSTTTRSYRVNWQYENGDPLKSEELVYGTVPSYTGTIPSQASSEGRTYTFKGWTDGTEHYSKDEPLPAITGETTFIAEFDETILTYPIRFIGFNGEVLQESNLAYGETPTYTGATPTQTGHTFSGWDSEITEVNGPKEYTAVFEACIPCDAGTGASCSLSVVANSCTYTTSCNAGYGDMTGNTTPTPSCTLQTYTITYEGITGANNFDNPSEYTILTPTIILTEPQKEGHTFKGWTPEGIIEQGSTGPKTFTATWEIKKSSITFDFANGEEPRVISGNYGDSFDTPDQPTKTGNTFSGWDKTIPSMIQEEPLTITAIWDPCTLCDAGTGAECSLSVVENKCTYTNSCKAGYSNIQNGTGYNPSCSLTEYTITYEGITGANNSENPLTYTIDSDTIVLQEPTKTGYTFSGWNPQGIIWAHSTGNKTFTAEWKVNEYQINFYTDTESGTIILTGKYGDTLTAPTGFAKDGAIFSGWNPIVPSTIETGTSFQAIWNFCTPCEAGTGAECKLSVVNNECKYQTSCIDGYEVAKNAGKYNPTCKPLSYEIHYKLNGGENNPQNPDTYTIEDETITLANPTRIGHNFSMWKEGSVIPAGSTGEKTFEALWDVNQYQITLNLDNGENPIVITGDYNSDIPSIEEPTKEGNTFSGWNDEIPAKMPDTNPTITALWNPCPVCEAGTGAECAMTVSGNVCTYINSCKAGYTGLQNATEYNPFCEIVTYNISYILSGGENGTENPLTYTVETPTISLSNPSRTGYDFLDWTPSNILAHGSTGDRNFTALWKAKTYQLIFAFNNGQAGIVLDQEYDTPIVEPEQPTRENHIFKGWDNYPEKMPDHGLQINAHWEECQACKAGTGADCAMTVSGNVCTYTNACKAGYENLQNATEYNPYCTPITYNISYILNDGVNDENNPNSYTIESNTINLGTPTKKGYSFLGWTPSDKIVEGSIGDKSFTANWEINQYTIKFYTNGGTSIKSITQNYGTEIPEITNPTKEGYTFAGWEEGEIPERMPDHNVELHARWTINSYEISWKNANGETLKVEELDYGTMPSYTGDTPEKEADKQYTYTFSHWEPTIKTVTKNQTYTAVYSKTVNKYRVTFLNKRGEEISSELYPYGTELNDIARPQAPYETGYKFNGWKLSSSMLGGMPQTITSNLELEPNYIEDSYTISYILEGNPHAEVKTTYGAQVVPITVPQKQGYSFSGWTPALPYNMPAMNLTVYGEYVINQRYLHFNTNGGNRIETRKLAYNAPIELPDIPKKEGYEFIGWDNDLRVMPDENVWFNAQWKQCQACEPGKGAKCRMYVNENNQCTYETSCKAGYEVDENEGKYNPTCKLISYPITYTNVTEEENNENNPDFYDVESDTIKLGKPTREGYTFRGWTPSSNIVKGSTGAKEFTATWTPNRYLIKLDGNGGVVTSGRIEGDYGTPIMPPENPVRTGYTFKGWDPEIPATMPITPETGLLITAQWEINQYTIAFEFDNGNPRITSTQDYGTPIVKPADPIKTGFKFIGWDQEVPVTMPATGLLFTAQYRGNPHTIIFDTAGGTEIEAITTGFAYEIVRPANPTRTGYTFKGWNPEIPATMPDEDITVVAQWEINGHTITFNTDGGTNIPEITREYGKSITKPANPTKTGYTFSGWDKEIPTTMPDEDITITALWNINAHTITFHVNGDAELAPITQEYGTPISKPADPTKKGYTFSGWDKEIPTTMPDEDMEITAIWTVNQYTLTFDSNGGSAIDAITQDYGTPITKPANPTWEGHTFKGWNPGIPTTMPDKNMTVTGTWTTNVHTITFVLDESEGIIQKIEGEFGTGITAPTNVVKTGYTFSGWDKEIPATMPDEDITITAQWKINQYTITFVLGNGENPILFTGAFQIVVQKPADPQWEGHTFGGWDKTIMKVPAHDDTVTAQWQVNQYVITFDSDGGTEVSPITGDYGTGIIAPADPTKEGYEFSGWLPKLPTTMPGHDVDVIAQWKPIQYRIDFDTDEGSEVESIIADYNTAITAPVNPVKTGYTFSGWNPNFPAKMPLHGLTLTAEWIANTGTQYLVEHQQEGLNGVYSAYEVFTGKGVTNSKITPEVKEYDGFVSPESEEITIKADGTTKIIYKYARKDITLHFETEGGNSISDKTGKYGSRFSVSNPTKTGYHFSGWTPVITETYPFKNTTYTANWNAVSYTIDYDLDGGVYGESHPTTAKYDEKVIIDNPTKVGYLFGGWKITGMDGNEHYYGNNVTNHNSITGTVETEFKNLIATEGGRVSFKALWIARADIQYTVNHHRAKLDEGYKTETEIFTGEANGITNAQAKIYSGFTFSGTIQQTNIAPDGSTVIDLYYTRNAYDIEFDSDGGTPVNTIHALYEAPVKTPKDPIRTGYTFKGWLPELQDTMPVEGLKVKAQWDTNSYIITYLSNGDERGTVPHTSTRVFYDQEVTIPNPIKTGYTFEGWRIVLMDNVEHTYGTTKTTEGTIENTKETVFKNLHATDGAPVLFIANWIANTDTKYTVNYHKESLTGDAEIETEIFEGTTNEITSVNEKYYQGFSLSGQIKDQKIKSDGSTVVDVYYKRNIHTISFDTKGGTEIKSIKKKYESDLSGVVTTIPTKTGSTFDGWEENIPATMPDEDIILTAKWSEKVYTAKFYTDGGTEIEDITGYYNDDLILPENPTKTGYTFVKWTPKTVRRFPDHDLQYTGVWDPIEYTLTFDTDGGTEIAAVTGYYGDALNTGSFVTTKTGSRFMRWSEIIPATMPAKNMEVKAIWEKIPYTLRFNSDGGTPVASIEGYYGDSIEKPADPTKTGNIFLGWEPNLSKIKTMPAENLVFTAQWETKVYTITFETDGGTEIDPITQKYDTPVTAPADPRKQGYTFNGWSKTIPSSMPAEDITIKAKWKINQYTMTFDANGGKFDNGGSQKTITKNYGETFKVPADPKKEKAEFKGWSGYLWNEDDIPTIPAEDKTFTANWNDCEVCDPENATCTVNVIDNKCTYTTFCIDGYNYSGTDVPENEGTAHPKCTPTVYTIEYYLDDEEGPKAVNPNTTGQYTVEDQNFTLLNPTRSGYNFVRWEGPMKKTVTEINTQTKKNIKLTAVWSSKTIHVTFDKNGGEGGTNELWYLFNKNKYFKDSSLKAPFEGITRPTRAGYTFVNYHGDGQFGGNDGEQYVSYYHKSESALSEFRNAKYYQEELDKKESNNLTEFASDFANDVYGDENGNATLIAERKPNKIHITFDKNTGTGGTNEIWYVFDTEKYYSDENLENEITKIQQPQKTGYTFVGYQLNGERYIAYTGDDGNFVNFAEDLVHEVSKDTTLVAIWEANTIKISLDPTPGTGGTKVFYYKFEDPAKKVYSDSGCTQEITSIERPTRPGYTFMNYHGDGKSGGESGERFVAYDDVEFASNLHEAIYKNAKLYATWEANTIKITLDKKGGTGGIDEFYYKFDTERFYSDEDLNNEIEEITVPTKRGYTFQSYDTGEMAYITYTSEHAHFKSGFASSFTEDTTLVANWGANKIHISLNKEGGTGGYSEFWYYYDTPKYYSDEACTREITEIGHPIKTGYIFQDYYSGQRFVAYQVEGVRKELVDDDIYEKIAADTELIARWNPMTIHVTLDKQEGIGGTDDFWYQYQTGSFYKDQNLTEEITEIEVPTKTGYEFTHYVGSGTAGGIIENTNYTTNKGRINPELRKTVYGDENGEVTLYAQWDANPYVIRYQNSADENDFIDEIVSFDTQVIITGNVFTRTGYTFSGWKDEEENIYQPGYTGENFVDSGMFVLKTIWQANEYTVQFLAGEGTGTMEDQVFTWDVEGKLKGNTFTRAGYNFKHWLAENGQTYSNLSSIKNLADSGTISLLAQWEVVKTTSRSSGGGGGGGSSVKRDSCPNGDHSDSYYDGKCEKDEEKGNKSEGTHGSAEEELTEEELDEIEEVDGTEYTKRDINLYEWAKKHKLTSMETIKDFRGDDGLTRAEMSKIISIFAKNTLGAEEKETKACSKFSDITKIKTDLHDYIITSCNLGFMGRTSDGKGVNKTFDPHSQVTKAEAVTIISRMFWGNEYKNKKGEDWYEGHLNHLIAIGVVDNDEDIFEPFARKDFYMILKKLYQLELD